jgi:hypothetical protein
MFSSSSVLDKALVRRYALLAIAGWSSQAARWAHNPKVAGSNPAPATLQKGSRIRHSRTFFHIPPDLVVKPRRLCHPLALVPQAIPLGSSAAMPLGPEEAPCTPPTSWTTDHQRAAGLPGLALAVSHSVAVLCGTLTIFVRV